MLDRPRWLSPTSHVIAVDVAWRQSPEFTQTMYDARWQISRQHPDKNRASRSRVSPKSVGRSAELSHRRNFPLHGKGKGCWASFNRIRCEREEEMTAIPASRRVPSSNRFLRASSERRSVSDRRSLRMVSDGCWQNREVLQCGLHRLVNRPVALVGAVAVGGAQSL